MLGEIRLFGGNFAPRGWALCDGQLLPIAQNAALFSLLGTTYGGDGRNTFALPDLRGRVPLHAGRGPGLTERRLGAHGGVEQVTLNAAEIPPHNHSLQASAAAGGLASPLGALLGAGEEMVRTPYTLDGGGVAMAPGSIANTGGGQPHTNVQPFLTVHYIIALQGVFPARN